MGSSLAVFGLYQLVEPDDDEIHRTKDIEDALNAQIPQHLDDKKKENVESLDVLLRDICNPKLLFGGKTVVFGGDFRQVFPVVPRKTQREAVVASLVCSNLWPKIMKFKLTENIRARNDPKYASFLLALRNAAFPEMDIPPFNEDIFTTRAIITPMNEDVDAINAVLIDKFPGEAACAMEHDYYASASFLISLSRKQIPLKLSFAMTINKEQGQTLSKLYAAVSRAQQSANVSVVTEPHDDQQHSSEVKNVISYDIFS
ncbi:uncharacterized protein LOC110688766 [Chenopodium quinoa]|uniref:uncharacterized protein LOC110688766 n=1 Tax=Chenopodium quinoa TaxID=63459 RepID=UPI000B7902F1|nr:uncharacterized protein LOC110688766 [Chenopodium quinoa]